MDFGIVKPQCSGIEELCARLQKKDHTHAASVMSLKVGSNVGTPQCLNQVHLLLAFITCRRDIMHH